MSNKTARSMVLAAMAVSVLGFSGAPTEAAVQVNPVPGLRQDFIKGADVSMLPEMEKNGAVFYDVDGTKMDELQIMKNHGVNWIRVRIWNDPKYGVLGGGGYTDEQRALELAKRAKAIGLKVLVDLHYSDGWADPGQQYTPHAWKNDSPQKLEQDVYDFTRKVVRDFQQQGTLPDMMQIGNEVKNGMLWPVGKLPAKDGGKAFSRLMASGLKAVRDLDPDHKIKLMIHLPDGGDNDVYRKFFDMLVKDNGVNDFDVIGFSYYPFWHGSLQDLQKNLDDVSARYGKEVVVAETAYGFTTDNYDQEKNHYGPAEARRSGFTATVQGQASGLRGVMSDLAAVPDGRGLGLFYWEPDWYAVPGAGWKAGSGNNWENLSMFDQNGKALDSWDVFRDVSDETAPVVPVTVTEMDEPEAEGSTGIPVKLPQSVLVTFSDEHQEMLPIVWKDSAPVYDKDGDYSVSGSVEKIDAPISCDVTIKPKANLLQNGDFESLSLDGWTVTGDKWTAQPTSGKGDAKGEGSLHYWGGTPYQFTMSQEVTGLTPGKYTVQVSAQGKEDSSKFCLFLIGDNGEKKTAEISTTGWNQWRTVKIADVEIKNGKAVVGVDMKGAPDKWGSVDNFKLYRQEDSKAAK